MQLFKKNKKKRIQPTVLIDSCSKLTIYKYLLMLESNDLNHLVLKGLPPKQEVLQSTFEVILEEFENLKADKKKTIEFDSIQYLEQLKIKVAVVFNLVNTLEQSIYDQLIDEKLLNDILNQLKFWGYKINKDIPVIDEIKRIHADLLSYNSTIQIMIAELYPEKENEETDVKDKVLAFHELLLHYKTILGIDINIKKTTLLELIAIEKQVLQRIESQKRNLNKNT